MQCIYLWEVWKNGVITDISKTFISVSSNFWPWATLQAVMPKKGSSLGCILPCCISMSGYIVVNHRENPLLWEMQTHAAGIQTHKQTHTCPYNTAHTQCHQNTAQPNGQECTHHIHTHNNNTVVAKSGTIRSAPYNSVVWMGSNNGALWHLNRARWRVSQEAE